MPTITMSILELYPPLGKLAVGSGLAQSSQVKSHAKRKFGELDEAEN